MNRLAEQPVRAICTTNGLHHQSNQPTACVGHWRSSTAQKLANGGPQPPVSGPLKQCTQDSKPEKCSRCSVWLCTLIKERQASAVTHLNLWLKIWRTFSPKVCSRPIEPWWHFSRFFTARPTKKKSLHGICNKWQRLWHFSDVIAYRHEYCAHKVSLNQHTDSHKRDTFPNRVFGNWW